MDRSTRNDCPFCNTTGHNILLATDVAVAIPDSFPASQGHTLVIPRRHVVSVFELAAADLVQLWELVSQTRLLLQEKLAPVGFNIGVNDGIAAGQTVSHAHVHVIPRFDGDVPDPRGGIRWVIPDKAAYWEGPS